MEELVDKNINYQKNKSMKMSSSKKKGRNGDSEKKKVNFESDDSLDELKDD
jgi:hypothetical protein